MQESAFESIRELLLERGLVVSESRYDQRSFGSWYIYIATTPRLGLVWDGRDGWLYVRREGHGHWDDLWVGREARDHTPDAAVTALIEFAR